MVRYYNNNNIMSYLNQNSAITIVNGGENLMVYVSVKMNTGRNIMIRFLNPQELKTVLVLKILYLLGSN